MVDILPDQTPSWRALEQIIHEEAAKFNFQEIRTPILEATELIKRGWSTHRYCNQGDICLPKR